MKQNRMVYREILVSCPDGSSIKTPEIIEVLVEWPDPVPLEQKDNKNEYKTYGPWVMMPFEH